MDMLGVRLAAGYEIGSERRRAPEAVAEFRSGPGAHLHRTRAANNYGYKSINEEEMDRSGRRRHPVGYGNLWGLDMVVAGLYHH